MPSDITLVRSLPICPRAHKLSLHWLSRTLSNLKGLNLLTETWAASLDLPRSLSLCRISVTGPPRHVIRKHGSCPLPLLAEGEHCYGVGGAGPLLHAGLKITSIFKAEEESLQTQRRRRLPRDRSSRSLTLLPNAFPLYLADWMGWCICRPIQTQRNLYQCI